MIVRPGLSLNGTPVSVKLLEEVKLRIASTDQDGIADDAGGAGLQAVRGPRIDPRVPRAAAAGGARRHADGQGEEPEPRRPRSTWRRARRSPSTRSTRPTRSRTCTWRSSARDYVIELLRPDRRAAGRTGRCSCRSSTATSRSRSTPTLKTDARGRIVLGPLPDIVSVTATGPEGTAHTWTLPVDRHTYRPRRSRQGRRDGDAAVPRHGGRPDARRAGALRGARRPDPRRPLRRPGDPRRPARAARPGRRRLRPVAEADRRADPHSRRGGRRGRRVRPRQAAAPGAAAAQAGADRVDHGRRRRGDGAAARRVAVHPRPRLRHALPAGVLGVRRPGQGPRGRARAASTRATPSRST